MSQRYKGKTWLYVLRDGHAVKIGITKNMEQRLDNLQTGNSRPIRVVTTRLFNTRSEAQAVEAAYHQIFRKKNVVNTAAWQSLYKRGKLANGTSEWFHLNFFEVRWVRRTLNNPTFVIRQGEVYRNARNKNRGRKRRRLAL